MSGGRDCDVLMEEGVSATTETMILSPPPSLSTASLNDGIDEDEEFDSQIIVEVEAPATLAGGYVFWATTSTSSNDENGSRRCKSPLGQRSAVTFPVQVVRILKTKLNLLELDGIHNRCFSLLTMTASFIHLKLVIWCKHSRPVEFRRANA